MSQIKYIKLENLESSDHTGRFAVDQSLLNELTESIRKHGILLPLIVKKHNSIYKIICGNNRFYCAKKVGLPSAPCIPTTGTELEQYEIQLHENLKRLPLSHMDQATSFVELREKFNLTLEQTSEIVGKTISYISQHITILNSGDNILQALNNNKINFTVARELSHIKDPVKRDSYLSYAVTSGASIETIQQWVRELKRDQEFIPENQPEDTGPAPLPINEHPESICDCCTSPMKTASIHFLRVCPRCNLAIKDAVSADNTKSSS